MKKNSYTLEQITSFSGFPSSSIFLFEQMGIVSPRISTNNRLYSDEDIRNLEQIGLLQSLGIPFSRISEIVLKQGFNPAAILKDHLANLLEEENDIMGVLKFSSAPERPELLLRRRQIEELISRTKKALSLTLKLSHEE